MATAAEVFNWLAVSAPHADDLAQMDLVLAAVEAHVAQGHTRPITAAPDYELAVVMQSARVYKRRNSPEGVVSFGEDGAIRVSSIDRDVAALLAPFRSWAFA